MGEVRKWMGEEDVEYVRGGGGGSKSFVWGYCGGNGWKGGG